MTYLEYEILCMCRSLLEDKRVVRSSPFSLWRKFSQQWHRMFLLQARYRHRRYVSTLRSASSLLPSSVLILLLLTKHLIEEVSVELIATQITHQLTSSLASKPRLSNFNSSNNGVKLPLLSFPNPSPGVHPIFFSRCIPIPLFTGCVSISWFFLAHAWLPDESSFALNTRTSVLPRNCPGVYFDWAHCDICGR